MKDLRWLVPALAAACLAGCDAPTAPTPPPPIESNVPVPGPHTGAVAIEYAGANIPPGSTIAGCGPTIDGCAGRLRLSFRLRSASAGPVLFTGATLHGVNKIACLSAAGDGFPFAANTTVTIELVFDRFNAACRPPFEVTDMGVNVEGTVEVASRQEFAIVYRFTP